MYWGESIPNVCPETRFPKFHLQVEARSSHATSHTHEPSVNFPHSRAGSKTRVQTPFPIESSNTVPKTRVQTPFHMFTTTGRSRSTTSNRFTNFQTCGTPSSRSRSRNVSSNPFPHTPVQTPTLTSPKREVGTEELAPRSWVGGGVLEPSLQSNVSALQ